MSDEEVGKTWECECKRVFMGKSCKPDCGKKKTWSDREKTKSEKSVKAGIVCVRERLSKS